MLDRMEAEEFKRKKPVEGTHREIVGTAKMNGKLLLEVLQRIKAVRIIKTLLVFAVAAFPLCQLSN